MNQKKIIHQIVKIIGNEKFSDEPELLEEYSKDRWAIGSRPIAIFFPHKKEDLVVIVKKLYKAGIKMIARGAGTGMTGGCIPIDKSVVISFEKMTKIIEINHKALSVTVEPGIIVKDLQEAVEKEGLFYPPSPASNDISTIGGNIAENSGGPRCLKYGVTGDYVLSLDVVLPDGSISTFGSLAKKDVAGFDLKKIIVGSEGMLGFICSAVLRLVAKPESSISFKVFFKKAEDAMSNLNNILMTGIVPSKAEFIGSECLKLISSKYDFKFPEKSGAALLLALDGTDNELIEQKKIILEVLDKSILIESAQGEEEEHLWELRAQISPSLKEIAPIKINEDVSLPLDRLAEIVVFCESLSKKTELTIAVFGHAGDGNLHVNFMINKHQYKRAEKAVEKLFKETVRLGGTITGEHGIGIAKSKYAEFSLDKENLELCKKIKKVFDPRMLINPGKAFYGPVDKNKLRGYVI